MSMRDGEIISAKCVVDRSKEGDERNGMEHGNIVTFNTHVVVGFVTNVHGDVLVASKSSLFVYTDATSRPPS